MTDILAIPQAVLDDLLATQRTIVLSAGTPFAAAQSLLPVAPHGLVPTASIYPLTGTNAGLAVPAGDPVIRVLAEPVLSGSAASGFAVTPTTFTGLNLGGAAIGLSRRWLLDGQALPGETGTILPTASLQGVGGVLSVEETLAATLADGDTITRVGRSNTVAAVIGAAPQFTTQPTITANPRVGDTVTLTQGVASGGASITIEVFLNGQADVRGQLVPAGTGAFTWNSAGAPTGTLSFRTRATNASGSTLSTLLTTPLLAPVAASVPAAFADADWTLADSPSAGGNQLSETIVRLPYDGGSPITALQRRVNGGAPVAVTPVGTGTRVITVPASVPASDELRAGNSAGFGPWSAPKSRTPTLIVSGSSPTLAQVEALYFDPTSRGRQLPTTKTVGIDALPAGWTYNASTRVLSANGACGDLIRWDTAGAQISIGATAVIREISNCTITEPGDRAISTAIINLAAGARIDIFAWNDVSGPGSYVTAGGQSVGGSLIRSSTTGSGALTVGPRIGLIERNKFWNFPNDGIKSTWGGIIRFNYFDTAQNMPYNPLAWSPTKSYAAGDLVRSGSNNQYVYASIAGGNVGHAPPTTVASNTYWRNVNPHSDVINPYGVIDSPLEIYGNFINRSPNHRLYGTPGAWGNGLNNALRFDKNTGTSLTHKLITAHHNVIAGGETLDSYAVSLGSPGTTDGNNWEPKVVRDNWIAPNSGGKMTFDSQLTGGYGHVFTNNVSYAIGAPPVAAVSRVHHAILGQSECAYILKPDSFYRQIAPGPLTSDAALVAYLQNDTQGAAPTKLAVTQAAVTGNLVNPGMAAMANMLDHLDPGTTYTLQDWAVPGTGMTDLVNDASDATDGRSWSDLTSVSALSAANGVSDPVVHMWWFNATAAYIKTFPAAFSPSLLGLTDAGAVFPLGTANAAMGGGRTDHVFWDRSGQSRGLLDNEARLALLGPMPFKGDVPSVAPELRNFSTTSTGGAGPGRITQLDRGAWEAVKTFAAKTDAAPIVSHVLEGMHLLRFGGAVSSSIHPSVDHEMGTIRQGQLFALSMAMANPGAGLAIVEPRFDGRALRDPANPKKVRLSIPLGSGDRLTTYAAQTAMPNGTAMPHWQPVMGLELRRLGTADTERRPIYRVDAGAAYPDAYKGTVVIEDDGSTTGTAVLLVTLVQDLALGDSFEFLRGGARAASLLRPRDDEAWAWMPLAYAAALDPGGTRPFRGLAVVSQPPLITVTQGGTVVPPPPNPVVQWDVDGADNQLVVQAAPAVVTPTAVGGINQIVISE